jgi:hypothetical protein
VRSDATTSLRKGEKKPGVISAWWRGEETELTSVQGRESFGNRGHIRRSIAGHIK